MNSSHALRTWVALCLLVVAVPALAQVDLYAISHPFALPTATTTRLFGMGGFSSCIPDVGFANPAFAGALTRDAVVVRNQVTSFEGDLGFVGQQGSFAIPLEADRQGMQVTAFRLHSNDADFGGFGVPATLSLDEYDVSVHYGRRLDSHWLAGVAVSPVFHNSLDVTSAGAPAALLALRAKAEWGGRVGVVYELGDRGWIGVVYDRYDEKVRASGLVLGGASSTTFHSDEIVTGIAYRLTDRFLAGVEWQQLGHKSGSMDDDVAGLRFGCEGLLDDGMSVRIGDNMGSFSIGLGWANADWSVNYAYIQDWNDNLLRDVYGGSETHSFEVTHSW